MVPVRASGSDWTESRTEAAPVVTPSDGMGTVYVSTASSPGISMPFTKLRIERLPLRERPLLQEGAEVGYLLPDLRLGGQPHPPLFQLIRAPSSRAAGSCSWRERRDRMRGDNASMVDCFVSRTSYSRSSLLPRRKALRQSPSACHPTPRPLRQSPAPPGSPARWWACVEDQWCVTSGGSPTR